MADIIQKATEWDKQSARFKKCRPLDTLHQTHIMQPKYDGCHLIIDTGQRRAFSRTNETVRSCDHLIAQCRAVFGTGWVIQGEAYMQDTAFPFISGKYRQHAPWEPMEFVAYDILPAGNFAAGRWDVAYHERLDVLAGRLGTDPQEGGVYLTESANALGHDVRARAFGYVTLGGYDGLILRDPVAPWVAGPSRNGEIVKVKPTTSLDLIVTDVLQEPGDKTGRPVYTIEVGYRGALTRVGSGVPHDLPSGLSIGAVVEVECMAVNPNNTLREPRFKGVKHDKNTPDT